MRRTSHNEDEFEMPGAGNGDRYSIKKMYMVKRIPGKRIMSAEACDQCSLDTLNDIADYLYGGKHHFTSKDQAKDFFIRGYE